ncbi:hypothetical protein B484DRAFT_45322 [Ochromonadaceae sp. CCMP2298]|nr:hypothetical protein B484DRAFT_45322 [Ochromonadaceae sp. CCMP2298]
MWYSFSSRSRANCFAIWTHIYSKRVRSITATTTAVATVATTTTTTTNTNTLAFSNYSSLQSPSPTHVPLKRGTASPTDRQAHLWLSSLSAAELRNTMPTAKFPFPVPFFPLAKSLAPILKSREPPFRSALLCRAGQVPKTYGAKKYPSYVKVPATEG